jgi:hypothetical protein
MTEREIDETMAMREKCQTTDENPDNKRALRIDLRFYDSKLAFLYDKLRYEQTGRVDLELEAKIRDKSSRFVLTGMYDATDNYIYDVIDDRKRLVLFYTESPLFHHEPSSIKIGKGGIEICYTILCNLFSLSPSPKIEGCIIDIYKLALRIRVQHVHSSVKKFIELYKTQYILPYHIKRATMHVRLLKRLNITSDNMCDILSFIQVDVARRSIDNVVYSSV